MIPAALVLWEAHEMSLDELDYKTNEDLSLRQVEVSLDVLAALARWYQAFYNTPVPLLAVIILNRLIGKAIAQWPVSVERANILAYRIGKAAFYMPHNDQLIDELNCVPETLDRIQIAWALEQQRNPDAFPVTF